MAKFINDREFKSNLKNELLCYMLAVREYMNSRMSGELPHANKFDYKWFNLSDAAKKSIREEEKSKHKEERMMDYVKFSPQMCHYIYLIFIKYIVELSSFDKASVSSVLVANNLDEYDLVCLNAKYGNFNKDEKTAMGGILKQLKVLKNLASDLNESPCITEFIYKIALKYDENITELRNAHNKTNFFQEKIRESLSLKSDTNNDMFAAICIEMWSKFLKGMSLDIGKWIYMDCNKKTSKTISNYYFQGYLSMCEIDIDELTNFVEDYEEYAEKRKKKTRVIKSKEIIVSVDPPKEEKTEKEEEAEIDETEEVEIDETEELEQEETEEVEQEETEEVEQEEDEIEEHETEEEATSEIDDDIEDEPED